MRMYDIIAKKRDGQELSKEEIAYVVNGFTKEEIPDYQMSAFLMSVYFRGMTKEETLNFTMSMANSGDCLDLSKIQGVKCDKHSTGGVGDKVSLILGPMVAACNIPVAKMSGRGLGHTGGTIDKLESIPGFQTTMSQERFIDQVNHIGIALVGQTAHLAPADKKIYALRDVTATVESMPLIASSIMSKKLAAGADTIVLDVKCGNGAFMKNKEDACALAKEMVQIGNQAGRKTIAVISDMNEPLGYGVGNGIEVMEACHVLQGKGEKRLTKLCVILGAYMLLGTGLVKSVDEGMEKMTESIESGKAFEKFKQFIVAQGGEFSYVENSSKLVSSTYCDEIFADETGYIKEIMAYDVGIGAMILGAGRETKESSLDYSAGFWLKKKTGDYVKKGECIGICYYNEPYKNNAPSAKEKFKNAFIYQETPVQPVKLIKDVIE